MIFQQIVRLDVFETEILDDFCGYALVLDERGIGLDRLDAACRHQRVQNRQRRIDTAVVRRRISRYHLELSGVRLREQERVNETNREEQSENGEKSPAPPDQRSEYLFEIILSRLVLQSRYVAVAGQLIHGPLCLSIVYKECNGAVGDRPAVVHGVGVPVHPAGPPGHGVGRFVSPPTTAFKSVAMMALVG